MLKYGIFLTLIMTLSYFAFISLPSCTKSQNRLRYDLTLQTSSAPLSLAPRASTGTSFSLSQASSFNIDSFVRASTGGKLGAVNIRNARLVTAALNLADPTDATNFANFQSCSGTFHTNTNSSEVGVTIANEDIYSSSLALPVDSTDELKNYFVGGNRIIYGFGGNLRRPTSDTLRCCITFTFNLIVE